MQWQTSGSKSPSVMRTCNGVVSSCARWESTSATITVSFRQAESAKVSSTSFVLESRLHGHLEPSYTKSTQVLFNTFHWIDSIMSTTQAVSTLANIWVLEMMPALATCCSPSLCDSKVFPHRAKAVSVCFPTGRRNKTLRSDTEVRYPRRLT